PAGAFARSAGGAGAQPGQVVDADLAAGPADAGAVALRGGRATARQPELRGDGRARAQPVRLSLRTGTRAPAGLGAAAQVVEQGLTGVPPTMRELILLRHAHAEPAVNGMADIDRALSPQGLAEAEAAGCWLDRKSV